MPAPTVIPKNISATPIKICESTVRWIIADSDITITRFIVKLWENQNQGDGYGAPLIAEKSFHDSREYFYTFSHLESTYSYKISVTAANDDGEGQESQPITI